MHKTTQRLVNLLKSHRLVAETPREKKLMVCLFALAASAKLPDWANSETTPKWNQVELAIDGNVTAWTETGKGILHPIITLDDLIKRALGDNSEELQLNNVHKAVITAEHVKVGCQTFTHDKIRELAAAVERVRPAAKPTTIQPVDEARIIHNPLDVPADKLPAGHRFMYKDELDPSAAEGDPAIRAWSPSLNDWSNDENNFSGSDFHRTYCVPIGWTRKSQ